jgi:hypothetical protein
MEGNRKLIQLPHPKGMRIVTDLIMDVATKNSRYVRVVESTRASQCQAFQPDVGRAVFVSASHGVVSGAPTFFKRAFGGSEEEFENLLIRPHKFIFNRVWFEELGGRAEFEQYQAEARSLSPGIIYIVTLPPGAENDVSS